MADTTGKVSHGFWEFKKYEEHEWFRFLIKMLIWTVLIYIASHVIVKYVFHRQSGYEYETLGKEQLQHINRIYFGSAPAVDTAGSSMEEGASEAEAAAPDTNLAYRNLRAIEYVNNQYSYKVDSNQMEKIKHYLLPAASLEAVSFWSTVRLRVRSYFWLVGPEVYFEIIFWTLLGVISSLLFALGMVSRNRTTDPDDVYSTTFDSSEIPYQFAKLWYAPIATLVIVLGYNFFEGENIADISSSKGVIVFAFIGGFYSARLISFLDRLKEVLLPSNSSADTTVQKQSAAAVATNTTITLDLHDESLPPELVNDIAEIGLGNATVVLENDENGDVVAAEKSGEDQSATFTVPSLKPGKYTVKATWANEVNTQPVNLAGEEKADIRSSGTTITVHLKKAESDG